MKTKMIGTCLGVIGICLWFMPLVRVNFFGISAYQSGIHIGGIAYLLIAASFAYAVLSWRELHIPRIIVAGAATAICLLYLLAAGTSTAWGLVCLTIVNITGVVLAVKNYRALNG